MKSVILLGSGRSGTSILGEVLQAAYQDRYLFEPDIGTLHLDDGPWALKLPHGDMDVALRGDYEEQRAAGWTEGLAFKLLDLVKLLPDAVWVWITRDPLDAVCSLRPGCADAWNHPPAPPPCPSPNDLDRAAWYWSYVNVFGFLAVCDRLVDVIHYEDLVHHPVPVVGHLATVLDPGVEALHRMSQVTARIGNVPGVEEAAFQVRWHKGDHFVRVGRWMDNLTPYEARRVRLITGMGASLVGSLTKPTRKG